MFNKLISFINKGKIIQNNIIIDSNLKPFIKNLEKDFFRGNFYKYNELMEYIKKYNSDRKTSYYLLILKSKFLLQLFKLNEFEETLFYIENEYKKFLDINFYELKLTLLSLKNKKEKFNNLANKIKIETDIPKEYFEMLYYLNNSDIEKAKDVYETLKEEKNFNILYNGFLIYSKLYEITQDRVFFEKADELIQKIKKIKSELNFFEKLSIYGFYGLSKINKFSMGKKDDIDFDINKYKKLVEIIIENGNYFDNKYLQKIINIYLYILLYQNDMEQYKKIISKYIEFISNFHYYNFLKLEKKGLNHEILQEKAKNNNENLIFYVSLLFEEIYDEDKNEIKQFLLNYKDEEFIIKDDYLIYIYCKFFEKIPKKIKRYIKDNKYKNLYLLLSFIKIFKYTKDDIEKLTVLAENENKIFGLLYDILVILQENKKTKDLIHLSIKKQNTFPNIVYETLKIIYENSNIKFNEFEYFLKHIKVEKEYYNLIGNIFIQFEKWKEAFEYFWNIYKENSDNEEIIISLLKLIWNYYNTSNEILDNDKENELYFYLLAKLKKINLNEIIFLFYYSLRFRKDINQIILILNKKLLESKKDDIDSELLSYLTNFYLLKFDPNYGKLFFVDNNICLVDEKKKIVYIKQNYNLNNFKTKSIIKKIDEMEFSSLKEKKDYKKESFLHIVLANIIFTKNNPNLIPMKVDLESKEPLKDLFDFAKQVKKKEIEIFKEYSNANNLIGLFNLAKFDYKNYFTLIPYLLKSKWNFNSLEPIYLNRLKILTFSSIIFLKELNLLDTVLNRKDIVIQKSLINWLKHYINEINYTNLPFDYNYLENTEVEFVPFTEKIVEETEKLKNELRELYFKLKESNLIDDHLETLPVKESFNNLADLIGFQEYWAFVYCINHNYQIISENDIFDFLFEQFNLNKSYISNSLALILNELTLKDFEYLKNCKYKYLVNKFIEENLIYRSYFTNFHFNDISKFLIREANKYGFLERIKKYYYYKYEILYPKNNLPKKTFFDKNIEKIIQIIKE